MSWEFDAPSGTYKNHALSSDIRMAAAAQSVFARWASPEQGYGKGKGASVTITRFSQLPLAGQVNEMDRLPTARPAINVKQQAVAEWGMKAELTELEESLSHFDLRNRVQRMLRDQMRLTMDKMVADAYLETLIKYNPTAAGTGTFATTGTPASTADVNLDVGHIREQVDYMSGTLKVPPFSNGLYVMILATRGARGIKNDSNYKDWLAPTMAEPFITGRLKNVENVALIETNHISTSGGLVGALDNDLNSGVCGEAIMFGDDAAFLAEVATPELRVGLSEDLGRFREIGWYGQIQAGLTWDNATEARAIHTAST